MQLGLIRVQQKAHVVVDEADPSRNGHIVLEFDIQGALVFYETLEVCLEEVLGGRGGTDLSRECAITWEL